MADGNRRPKRFTAEQALQLLQLIDYDDSGDEGSIILNDVHVDQDSDPDEEAPPPSPRQLKVTFLLLGQALSGQT